MVAITEDQIRELAVFKGEDGPVTSCYLDVDGGRYVRHSDLQHQLDHLIRQVRPMANASPSVAADLLRIEGYVKGGFDRSKVRGLAMFSSSRQGLWKVFELPVAVRPQLTLNHTPAVRQLEAIVDQHERLGLLLADRQRARILVFEMGELVDSSYLFEQLPRNDDDDHSYRKDENRDHVAALARQHLRHAAQVAFQAHKEHGFERLVVGAPEDVANELESALHPYLKARLEARVSLSVGATDEEIRKAALAVEAVLEKRKQAELVGRLRDACGAGRKGVAGLDATLSALVERRVETLVISHGYADPGWRCPSCSYLGRVGRKCPVCETSMRQIDDIVEEAVEEALQQSCHVETCVGNADLDVLGRIGALLRY